MYMPLAGGAGCDARWRRLQGKPAEAIMLLPLLLLLVPLIAPVAQAAEYTTIVDLSDNSGGTVGKCNLFPPATGRCNLNAALRLAAADIKLRIELHVDCDSPGASAVPAGADVTIVGLVGGAPNVAQIHGGQGTFLRVLPGASLRLQRVRISQRLSTGYQPAVLSNSGTVSITDSEIANNTQSASETGAMTAYAMASAGAILNNNNATMTFGDNCNVSNNTALAMAYTAAFTGAVADSGAILNHGKLSFGDHCTFENNVASALSQAGYHPEPGGATANSAAGFLYVGAVTTLPLAFQPSVTFGGASSSSFLSHSLRTSFPP